MMRVSSRRDMKLQTYTDAQSKTWVTINYPKGHWLSTSRPEWRHFYARLDLFITMGTSFSLKRERTLSRV